MSAPAPQPGVGVLYNPTLTDFVRDAAEEIDYLSVIPDRTWVDRGVGAIDRFAELPEACTVIRQAAGRLPVVMHAIGLSICSAEVFDDDYLRQIAGWAARHDCLWTSEHLSFSRVGSGHETNAAVALPVPYDCEMLDLLIPRVLAAQDQIGRPFLLENNVAYIVFPDQDMDEAAFLNRLTEATGCGLLLDLHNLYTNALNHGFDTEYLLDRLDLGKVVEVHIAGGDEMMGFHLDSHSGPTLEGVWQLLALVTPRAPNLRGVTFEFHESSWPRLRTDGVLTEIARTREILARTHAA
jgi:uncharacterized protein